MPFKNNADKNVWRRAYRLRYLERHNAWAKKCANRPEQVAKRKRRKQINDERLRGCEIRRDLKCLAVVMRQMRKDIMVRDGLAWCFGCKKIKPIADVTKGLCGKCSRTYAREYRANHKDQRRVICRCANARMKLSPLRLMRTRIRGRLSKAIKLHARGISIKGSKLRYLGCSAQDACDYLEQQFKKGMTWSNYGRRGWNIDHVIPVSAFDLANEEQRKKAFHYTNLQPLWEIDNMRKNDTMPSEPRQPMLSMPRQ